MDTRADSTDDEGRSHQVCRVTSDLQHLYGKVDKISTRCSYSQLATLGSSCRYPMMRGGVTIPPTIAKACCNPMTAATTTDRTSSDGKNGGPL